MLCYTTLYHILLLYRFLNSELRRPRPEVPVLRGQRLRAGHANWKAEGVRFGSCRPLTPLGFGALGFGVESLGTSQKPQTLSPKFRVEGPQEAVNNGALCAGDFTALMANFGESFGAKLLVETC